MKSTFNAGKLAIAIAAAAGLMGMASYANATNNGNNGNNGDAHATANATGGNASATGGTHIQTNTQTTVNTNTNVNTLGQAQGQHQGQGQMQGQGQLQGQSQNANNNGNAQQTTVTVNEGNTPKQATSGPGIASSPSATCRIAVGASVGGTFGGFGAFGSVEDERCADMERGRHMAEVLGRKDAAKALACKDAKMAEALGDCPKAKTAETEQLSIKQANTFGGDQNFEDRGAVIKSSYDPFSTAPQPR